MIAVEGRKLIVLFLLGTGCMAALECEKFLAEHEGTDSPENDNEVKKGKPEADGEVPEYRSNPLL